MFVDRHMELNRFRISTGIFRCVKQLHLAFANGFTLIQKFHLLSTIDRQRRSSNACVHQWFKKAGVFGDLKNFLKSAQKLVKMEFHGILIHQNF